MVSHQVVFADVVGAIKHSFLPKIFELALCIVAFSQLKHWSFDLDAFGTIVPIASPCGMMLLVVTGVGAGWAWLIFSRVDWTGVAFCIHNREQQVWLPRLRTWHVWWLRRGLRLLHWWKLPCCDWWDKSALLPCFCCPFWRDRKCWCGQVRTMLHAW